MKSEIPISIAKYDSFDLIYFDPNYMFSMPWMGTAYLALEIYGQNLHGNIRCYLNGEERDAKCFQEELKWCRNEILLDISEIFLFLVCGLKENKGFIFEYGQNCIYSCRLFFEYEGNIIDPTGTRGTFYEHSFCICSNNKLAVSPFFQTSNASTSTFAVQNFGEQSIFLSIENSPNAQKVFHVPQEIEVLPGEVGLIIPIYFTKYVRLGVSSSQGGILARVWYQSQQVK